MAMSPLITAPGGGSAKMALSRPFGTAAEMAKFVASGEVEFVDACFVDPLGLWHHCTFAPSQVEERDILRGFAFDGSSIRLFSSIEASDMLMVPDVKTCWIDPFAPRPTLHVTCSVCEPSGAPYLRCPRNTAQRAVDYLKESGIGDTAFFGPEAEFFVFRSVSYDTSPNSVFFNVDGEEGPWNSKRSPSGCSKGDDNNLAHRCPMKRYYFPVAPIDKGHVVRSEMLSTMNSIGVPIEKHHHEVASCQHELGYTCRPLIESADLMMCYKYVVKNVAASNNLTATFMPKPIAGDNGSGMHCHQSLWKDGRNLFFDESGKYMKLSTTAMHYIGGLLRHAAAVLAFTNSTVNSYKRLVPGYEAPVNLVYSKGNRSAAIRIPLTDADVPKAKRLEFRCPDPAGNVYLAYTAMLMAGLDGIRNKIEPPAPMDCDVFELSKEEQKKIASTPHRLEEALDALEADNAFLTVGGVFTKDFIDTFIAFKRQEAKDCSMIPHPKEYDLYYNC